MLSELLFLYMILYLECPIIRVQCGLVRGVIWQAQQPVAVVWHLQRGSAPPPPCNLQGRLVDR